MKFLFICLGSFLLSFAARDFSASVSSFDTPDPTPKDTFYITFSQGMTKVYSGSTLLAKRSQKGVWTIYNTRKSLEAMYENIVKRDSVS